MGAPCPEPSSRSSLSHLEQKADAGVHRDPVHSLLSPSLPWLAPGLVLTRPCTCPRTGLCTGSLALSPLCPPQQEGTSPWILPTLRVSHTEPGGRLLPGLQPLPQLAVPTPRAPCFLPGAPAPVTGLTTATSSKRHLPPRSFYHTWKAKPAHTGAEDPRPSHNPCLQFPARVNVPERGMGQGAPRVCKLCTLDSTSQGSKKTSSVLKHPGLFLLVPRGHTVTTDNRALTLHQALSVI